MQDASCGAGPLFACSQRTSCIVRELTVLVCPRSDASMQITAQVNVTMRFALLSNCVIYFHTDG